MPHKRLLILALGAASLLPVNLYATSVVFPNFTSTAGLTLSGSAAVVVTSDGSVLRLVPAIGGQHGSTFSSATINAAAFSTFFQFRFTALGNSGADGIVFVIQPVSSSIGVGGGGEGYLGIAPSIGVEFDIFRNAFDPDNSHIGVLTNGIVSTYVGGPYSTPTPLANGDLWSAWIDYDGTTLTVRVADGSTVRPANPVISTVMNVPSILGTSTAFVGFTAGTGAAWANHDIIAWQYNDTFSPITQIGPPPTLSVPAASTLSLLLIGIGLAATAAYQVKARRDGLSSRNQ